jgi:hypothetical protein
MTSFSFIRTGRLILKNLIENKKTTLIFPVVLFGVLFVLLLIPYSRRICGDSYEQSTSFQKLIFLYAIMFASAAYASFQFKDIRRNPGNIQYLMLPSTSGEKFASGLFLSIPVFFIAFILIFFLANFLSCTVCGFGKIATDGFFHPSYKNLMSFKILFFDPASEVPFGIMALLSFLTIQSYFLFGAVKFKEIPFAYTMLCYTIFGFLNGIIDIFLAVKWLNPMEDYFNHLAIGNPGVNINMVPKMFDYIIINPLMIVFSTVIFIGFWSATYFAIKEKQVK